MLRAWLAILALTSATLLGCGGNTDQTTIVPGGDADSRLESALFTLDDLPQGWASTAPPERKHDSAVTGEFGCDIRVTADTEISVKYLGPAAGSTSRRPSAAAETVYLLPKGKAKEFLDRNIECANQLSGQSERQPLDVTKHGDQTFGVRTVTDLSGVPAADDAGIGRIVGDAVYSRRGDIVILLINMGVGVRLTQDSTRQLLDAADKKLIPVAKTFD